MRAIWKGAVSFGLVSVPVRLYAATESHDISFRQVHAKDGGRIKYQRVCSIDGEEVAYADIAKGYETEDGQMVVLDDEDLAELPASSSREISVEKFVPSDQIDPMWLEKSYYLEPDKAAAKPYALLREALKEADRVAVVTVSIRTRMTTAVLRVRDDVIVMQTMLWPDEVRRPDFAGLDATEHAAKPNELKMAKLLVETLAGDYDADDYEDDYQKAVESLVQAKLEGGEVKAPEEPRKATGEVVDLLAALQRSVDAARSSRGESPAADDDSAASDEDGSADAEATARTKPTSKKAAAKKSTTGKAAAKSTAKKASANKSAQKKAAEKKSAPKKSTQKKATAKKAS
jgi:DNA end-binding protein Ku